MNEAIDSSSILDFEPHNVFRYCKAATVTAYDTNHTNSYHALHTFVSHALPHRYNLVCVCVFDAVRNQHTYLVSHRSVCVYQFIIYIDSFSASDSRRLCNTMRQAHIAQLKRKEAMKTCEANAKRHTLRYRHTDQSNKRSDIVDKCVLMYFLQ